MIETDRLILKPMEEEDRAWFRAQATDALVMRHLGGPQTIAAADAKFDSNRALLAEYGFTFWLLVEKAGGERIGICGLKAVDAPGAKVAHGHVEIGWRLSPPWWGKGYAREAASAALDHAFAITGAPAVVAFTSSDNVESWGLMERLGMTRRADLDFDDPRYPPDANPTIVYLIEASQWKA